MVNSLAIARIAISTRNLRLSSLRLYVFLREKIFGNSILACVFLCVISANRVGGVL